MTNLITYSIILTFTNLIAPVDVLSPIDGISPISIVSSVGEIKFTSTNVLSDTDLDNLKSEVETLMQPKLKQLNYQYKISQGYPFTNSNDQIIKLAVTPADQNRFSTLLVAADLSSQSSGVSENQIPIHYYDIDGVEHTTTLSEFKNILNGYALYCIDLSKYKK